MIIGESTARGERRQRAAWPESSVLNEGPPLALRTESEILERQQDRDCERVIGLQHVDVCRGNSRHAKRLSSGHDAGGYREIRHLGDVPVRVALASAEDTDRSLSGIPRTVRTR